MTSTDEAPPAPDAALVPSGELAAFGLLLERTEAALEGVRSQLDAEVTQAVEAERERIRAAVTDLKFTLFRPGNGPADTRSLMDVVPLDALLALLGPEPDGDGPDGTGEGGGSPFAPAVLLAAPEITGGQP